MTLKKYWIIARGVMQETMIYRLNFVMWRLRVVLQTLTVYFLWLSLLPKNSTLFGYSQSLMLTYVLGTSLVGSLAMSTRTGGLGDEINNGNLSNYLVRPVNYFLTLAASDFGDKVMNTAFSIIELIFIYVLLAPPLFIQTNLTLIALTIVGIIFASAIIFFTDILIGTVGFWSNEVWAPRFIFFILLQFFSGSLFPLDILPKPLFLFFQSTPFPYMLYFPLKIYLGQLSYQQIFQGLAISLIWILLTYALARTIWNKGLKLYTAQGR